MMVDWHKKVSSAHEIMPGLWIGNQSSSENVDFLRNIDMVVNASKHIAFTPVPGHYIKYVRVNVNDPGPIRFTSELSGDQAIMYNSLSNITKQIHDARMRGKRVLIHCHAGMQRSAAIMTAYLVRYGVWSEPKYDVTPADLRRIKFDSAVDLLVRKRPAAFFGGRSINFKPALTAWLQI